MMETMNVVLPDSMKAFVQERVSENGYSSATEYVHDLIRADQKRRTEERLEGLLLEGLNSGEPIEVTSEYWEEKKRRLSERPSNWAKEERRPVSSSSPRPTAIWTSRRPT